MKQLLKVPEVSELTGKSVGATYTAIRKGQLPADIDSKPFRVKRSDALEWASPPSPPIPKDEMRRLYHDEEMSITDLAEYADVGRMTIYRWMKKLGIPRRSLSEANKLTGGPRQYMSDEAIALWRKRQSEARTGRKMNLSFEERQRRSQQARKICKRLWNDGTFGSPEWKEKQRQAHAGENCYRWNGGGVEYRGPNWQKQRRKARKRDNYTCQDCGVTEADLGQELDVHHIIPFREFDSHKEANQLDNLISYCKPCHISIEHRECG